MLEQESSKFKIFIPTRIHEWIVLISILQVKFFEKKGAWWWEVKNVQHCLCSIEVARASGTAQETSVKTALREMRLNLARAAAHISVCKIQGVQSTCQTGSMSAQSSYRAVELGLNIHSQFWQPIPVMGREEVTSPVLQLPRNVLKMTAYDCCRQYLINCHYKTHVRAWGRGGIWCLISFQNNNNLLWNKLVNEFCCLINQVISIWPPVSLPCLILSCCISLP